MEAGGSNVVVFLDLAKAFDFIQHDRVLASLSLAGVSGHLLDWFTSSLSDRQQFVAVQGCSSLNTAVTSGIPQGSILGPLLFLLAFDGIFRLNMSAKASLVGYADDCTYSKAVHLDADLEDINSDLALINSWLKSQNLRLNHSKVKCMVISRRSSPPSPVLFVEGHRVELVSTFKLLGVLIDSTLSWRSHIETVCTRAKKLIGFLYRSFKLSGPSCLNHLYKALVLPVLDYSSSIWDPQHNCHITALERVQNFAARVVTNNWSDSPVTLKARLGWLSLARRRMVQKICLCRHILRGTSLVPCSLFSPHPRPGTQHKNSFVRTNHFKSFFLIDVIGKWNSVPEAIASASSTLAFKLNLKKLYNLS